MNWWYRLNGWLDDNLHDILRLWLVVAITAGTAFVIGSCIKLSQSPYMGI